MKKFSRRQGTLSLVLLGSALGLTACGQSWSDAPETVSRGTYQTKSDCVADWKEQELCEERTSSGGGAHYWGPYYSQAGRVYGYDGRVRQITQAPSRAMATERAVMSESQIHRTAGGKYASTAKVSRGGFGGRAGSSFGG